MLFPLFLISVCIAAPAMNLQEANQQPHHPLEADQQPHHSYEELIKKLEMYEEYIKKMEIQLAKIDELSKLGFSIKRNVKALKEADWDVQVAENILLEEEARKPRKHVTFDQPIHDWEV